MSVRIVFRELTCIPYHGSDHKSTQSVEVGNNLTLDLYTHQAETVVFQNSNSTEWRELWQRQRGREVLRPWVEERNGQLVIRSVTKSDEGMYKVMDGEGLALSTVRVFVTGNTPSSEHRRHRNLKVLYVIRLQDLLGAIFLTGL